MKDLEILVIKYKEILKKNDLKSLIYYLILCNLCLKYKVMFNFISEKINYLIKNKDILKSNDDFTIKEFEEIDKLIEDYKIKIKRCNFYN